MLCYVYINSALCIGISNWPIFWSMKITKLNLLILAFQKTLKELWWQVIVGHLSLCHLKFWRNNSMMKNVMYGLWEYWPINSYMVKIHFLQAKNLVVVLLDWLNVCWKVNLNILSQLQLSVLNLLKAALKKIPKKDHLSKKSNQNIHGCIMEFKVL